MRYDVDTIGRWEGEPNGDDAVHRAIAKRIAERPLTTPPGLRVNGHLPSCKCWRCEKLDGAA